MLNAMLWSGVATVTLLIGMVMAFRGMVGPRWTALIMAFGAGAIVSAVAYQLVLGAVVQESGSLVGPATTQGLYLVAIGIAAGAATFYLADRWVDGRGGQDRLDFEGKQASGSGMGILLGSLLDGVPESLVLGLSLVHSPEVSLAFVFAVAISNVPQGLGGTTGMLSAGWPRAKVTRLWLAVCGLSIAAAALGYWLGMAQQNATGAVVDAFAAGALLVMLTDSMIPEAYEHGGRETGLFLALGFGVAAAVTVMQLP